MMQQQQPSAERGSNGLGVAGFVVSLIGLVCSMGVISPIGLVMSLFALGRQPRGLAIAGVVLGAIGTCGLVLSLIFIPIALAFVLAAAGLTAAAVAIGGLGGPGTEAQVEMFILATNIEQRTKQTGSVPASLDEITAKMGTPQYTDPWDKPYRYEVTQDGSAFRLYSSGPDGIPANADDVRFEIPVQMGGPSHLDPTPAVAEPPPPEPVPPTTDDASKNDEPSEGDDAPRDPPI